jgi:hypothetical protein
MRVEVDGNFETQVTYSYESASSLLVLTRSITLIC